MFKSFGSDINKAINEAGGSPQQRKSLTGTAPTPPLNQRTVDQAFERAITLLQADNKPGAEASMREAVEKLAAAFKSSGPVYADALFKLGLVLAAVGDLSRAADACRAAVAVPTGDEVSRKARLNYQLNLGDLLTRLGRYDEAEAALRECLAARRTTYGERHAGYAAGLSAMAELELARGRGVESLALVDEAVQVLSAGAPGRLPGDLALRAYAVKLAHGATAPGADAFDSLGPDGRAALVRAAIQRSSAAPPAAAQAVLSELRERLGEGGDAALRLSVAIALSHVAKETGDHDVRIGSAREAVALCAAMPERSALAAAHRNVAQAYADAGRHDEVPAAYDAAVAAAREAAHLPLLSDVLRTYALWADGIGKPDVAEPLYVEAAHHGASSGDWSTHGRSSTALGVFMLHQGRTDQAKRWLEEAIAHLPPNHADLAIAREHLDALNRGVACRCRGGE